MKENVDTLIESTKSKYPACFSVIEEGGTPPVNPIGGNPPRPLTIADVKKMTTEQINANWAEVQKALANGK